MGIFAEVAYGMLTEEKCLGVTSELRLRLSIGEEWFFLLVLVGAGIACGRGGKYFAEGSDILCAYG
jgi:hypothetical protein